MTISDPLAKPRMDFESIIAQLSSADSPVGIDAQYTHAVIIDYLSQIASKLEAVERKLDSLSGED